MKVICTAMRTNTSASVYWCENKHKDTYKNKKVSLYTHNKSKNKIGTNIHGNIINYKQNI